MSNPIQKIKTGLINGDLKEIAEGYLLLTGEDIQVSNSVGRYSFQKMLDILFDTYENYHGKQVSTKPTKPTKNETKKPKKEPLVQRSVYGNKSVPITEEAKASEVEKNKQNVVEKPKRKPKQKYSIMCPICGDHFDSYDEPKDNIGKRCNACLMKAIKGG